MRRFCIVAVSVGSLLIAGAPAQAHHVAVKNHRAQSRGDTIRVHQAAPSIAKKHGYPYGRT
jgi:hypothetical protein